MKASVIMAVLLYVQLSGAAVTIPKGAMALTEKKAPALELKDSDGQAYRIQQSLGRWVMVHFWASWCGPCRRELPSIQAMAKTLDRSVWDLVLVNTAETDDAVFSYLGLLAPDLNTLMDRDGAVTERWQPRGLPATYFVNPRGKLVYMTFGGQDWQSPEYQKFIKDLSLSKK